MLVYNIRNKIIAKKTLTLRTRIHVESKLYFMTSNFQNTALVMLDRPHNICAAIDDIEDAVEFVDKWEQVMKAERVHSRKLNHVDIIHDICITTKVRNLCRVACGS